MPAFWVHPEVKSRCQALGLQSAQAFLSLPGAAISGHPSRHVRRVTLHEAATKQIVYLKREHSVPWKDRWHNAWAGFGWVAKACREATNLQQAQSAGIACPKVWAVGEQAGRAFLLLEALPQAQPLPSLLAHSQLTQEQTCQLAQRIGSLLARLHQTGFEHGDLFAKHLLVSDRQVSLIDWQRARQWRRLPWQSRSRDLACLWATLPESLLPTPAWELAWDTYVRESGLSLHELKLRSMVEKLTARYRQRKQVQKQLLPRSTSCRHEIVWVEEESLCVEARFWDALAQAWPTSIPKLAADPNAGQSGSFQCTLPTGQRVEYRQETRSHWGRWLASLLTQQPILADEVQAAGRLYRQEQQGQPGPRMLAFGQRALKPWRISSFLLTEVPADA